MILVVDLKKKKKNKSLSSQFIKNIVIYFVTQIV